MPKFLVEREMPGAGKMSANDLQDAAQKSCEVLRQMGPEIQWLNSYIADDKVYCLYIAPGEDPIRKHADQSGFPASRISRIAATIDPATAEEAPAAG